MIPTRQLVVEAVLLVTTLLSDGFFARREVER